MHLRVGAAWDVVSWGLLTDLRQREGYAYWLEGQKIHIYVAA